jgi:hypothetical protein
MELINFENNLIESKTFLTSFTEYMETLLEFDSIKDTYKCEI